jgi:hypothetical protein
MARITLALISVVLMLVLVERTVSFTAVDASWGKRSEKVRVEILAYTAYMCSSILLNFLIYPCMMVASLSYKKLLSSYRI